jgi:TonB family protein
MLLTAVFAAALQAGATVGDLPVRLDPTMPEPRLVKVFRPEHPEEARKVGLQGAVVVEVTVDAEGRVADASAVNGDAPLTDAAVKAVKRWRYEPLVLDGHRKAFVRTVRVNFLLERPTLLLTDLIQSLSSRYEAVRECAATRLGRLFNHRDPSREVRWTAQELKALLDREQSPRVREAAQNALAGLEVR